MLTKKNSSFCDRNKFVLNKPVIFEKSILGTNHFRARRATYRGWVTWYFPFGIFDPFGIYPFGISENTKWTNTKWINTK